MDAGSIRLIIWLGSSRRDLRALPEGVRRNIGQALYTAQQGETDPAAKPLKGFGGTRVMEIVERDRSGAYRAAYTAQLGDAIYVLHVFQKKSKRGIATPKQELDLIRRRLAEAERRFRERQN
ncbi:MAG: type II toxin-antitoxin system RelE/ParE family toxin [Pseudolabrys sp.]|jgi:phage-related protein